MNIFNYFCISYEREHARLFLYSYFLSYENSIKTVYYIDQALIRFNDKFFQDIYYESAIINNQVREFNILDEETAKIMKKNSKGNEKGRKFTGDVSFNGQVFWKEAIKNRRADDLLKLEEAGKA